ncbi:glycerophosphodiester phosphodiesterase family protein [uncultured Desulfobacter sp.]|uniref:glycerophosphodiester phosphodiesterase n=1 Tax=uncultured Desulfobacter sp. TaxID=240139 RepID=UPI002AAC2CA8|nr:glycerophosphodiester phosphodiesterase family protein [uncultured Desulfobacter sp.]
MSGGVEIIAHRGARSLAPENTLSAARLAHKLGAHRWETDAVLTRDGHLVLFHDEILTRCTNAAQVFGYNPKAYEKTFRPGAGVIDRLDSYSFAELQLLDAGSWFQLNDPYGTVSGIDPQSLADFKGENIPTLYDGLVLTKKLDWRINVEIKDHGHEPGPNLHPAKVLAELVRSGIAPDQVTLSSFNHDWLRWLRQRAPEYEIQALVGNIDDIPLDFNASVFTGAEFEVLNLNTLLVTPSDIRKLKNAGKRINLFTINEHHDYIRFVDAGVDGIFTDFPQRFI